ncbi:MAG: hypothetical protein A2Z49_06005 [Chloroflexi bacterium RBG_19FT_COMBO_56_12]|nr:MAG: hypothetical protein A2Z49_06005 [Chloroflexi bacterium RBG_19FT_COMBO_56_12]
MVDQITKITSRGRVTIPKAIRQALGVNENDRLLFVVDGSQAMIIPLKHRALSEFRGALPATRMYAGMETVREIYHNEQADRLIEEKK